jgi:5-methylcytosine-specific restriction endonuclease McrA
VSLKRTELKPDPDRVRAWLAKSRQPLKRGNGLERRSTLKPGKRKRRWSPPAWMRRAVLERTSGACAACLARAGANPYDTATAHVRRWLRAGLVRRAVHLHHCLPRERWPEHERDADNLVGVCAECHDDHERANARIPHEAVPRCALALAAAAGAAEADYIAKTYPHWGAEPGGTGRRVVGGQTDGGYTHPRR